MKQRTIAEIEEMTNAIMYKIRTDESDLFWALFDAREFAERRYEDIDKEAWDTVRHTVLDILRDIEEE